VLEVTFLRKDRADATGYATHFPHPLDRPNARWMSAPPLPARWHR
jgi:hypothetical protein